MNRQIDWPGLDLSKFLCVAAMIFIHAIFWLVSDHDVRISTSTFVMPFIQQSMVLGLLPLSIPITAGCMLRMHLQPYWGQPSLGDYSLIKIVGIAFFLVMLGFLMNGLAFGLSSSLSWDVLQFMALSYVIIAVLLKVFPVWLLAVMGVYVLLVAEFVATAWPALNNHFLLTLWFTSSPYVFWPFFPWFSVVVFGFFVAHLYLQQRALFVPVLGIASTGLVFFSVLMGDFVPALELNNIWGSGIFQPSPVFMVGLMGFFGLLITVSSVVMTRFFPVMSNTSLIHCYSKGILWIYVLHIIVGYRLAEWLKPLWPLSVLLMALPLFLWLMAWGIGWLNLRYFYRKKWTIVLRPIN